MRAVFVVDKYVSASHRSSRSMTPLTFENPRTAAATDVCQAAASTRCLVTRRVILVTVRRPRDPRGAVPTAAGSRARTSQQLHGQASSVTEAISSQDTVATPVAGTAFECLAPRDPRSSDGGAALPVVLTAPTSKKNAGAMFGSGGRCDGVTSGRAISSDSVRPCRDRRPAHRCMPPARC
jgi:hypothetical protein